MNITNEQLKKLLNEAFEAGFYGSKDLQENVVEELMDRAREKAPIGASDPITVTLSNTDGSASYNPWLSHQRAPSSSGDPADRRTWNLNNDVFVSSPPMPELELNIETQQIQADPNSLMDNAMRQMIIEEDSRLLASISDTSEEQNDNEDGSAPI